MKTFGAFKDGILYAWNLSKSVQTALRDRDFLIKEISEQELKDLLYRQWEIRRSINNLQIIREGEKRT